MNVSKRIFPFGFLFLFLFLLSSFGKDSQRISIDTVLLEERFKIRKLSKFQGDSLKWAFADIAAQRREIIQGRLCGGARTCPPPHTHTTQTYVKFGDFAERYFSLVSNKSRSNLATVLIVRHSFFYFSRVDEFFTYWPQTKNILHNLNVLHILRVQNIFASYLCLYFKALKACARARTLVFRSWANPVQQIVFNIKDHLGIKLYQLPQFLVVSSNTPFKFYQEGFTYMRKLFL